MKQQQGEYSKQNNYKTKNNTRFMYINAVILLAIFLLFLKKGLHKKSDF